MKMKKYISGLIVALIFFPGIVKAASPEIPTLNPVNQESLLITGLTQKGTDVIVFVDGEFLGVANVSDEGTESNNFSFSAQGLLEPGEHTTVVAAKDLETLSLSNFSTGESFTVVEEKSLKPSILETAVSEEVNNVEQIEAENVENNDFIIEEVETDTQKDSDMIEKNENFLKWNLAIFIFFLVSVIAWIFWVNNELKKEKAVEEKNSKE